MQLTRELIRGTLLELRDSFLGMSSGYAWTRINLYCDNNVANKK